MCFSNGRQIKHMLSHYVNVSKIFIISPNSDIRNTYENCVDCCSTVTFGNCNPFDLNEIFVLHLRRVYLPSQYSITLQMHCCMCAFFFAIDTGSKCFPIIINYNSLCSTCPDKWTVLHMYVNIYYVKSYKDEITCLYGWARAMVINDEVRSIAVPCLSSTVIIL
jgi:hypothetical protein